MTHDFPLEYPEAVPPPVRALRMLQGGLDSGLLQRLETFVHEWVKLLGGSGRLDWVDNTKGWSRWRTVSEGVFLKGFQQFPMLIITGAYENAHLRELASLPALMVVSRPDVALELRRHPGAECWVIVGLVEMEQILGAGDSTVARQGLLRLIRGDVPRWALIPFQTSKAVDGSMFQGRLEEWKKLFYERETSFALVGPPRIGKTSLAYYYKLSLSLRSDIRSARLYVINFQNLALRTDDAVAQEIARVIPCVRRTMVTAERLYDFLHRHAREKGGPLELILDECDEICHLWVFDQLCEWSRLPDSPCRLIAMGKTHLVHKVLGGGGNAPAKLEAIRPRPLTKTEVGRLFGDPLKQLGIALEDERHILEEVWTRTSGLPHLVQRMGKRVAERSCEELTDTVTMASLDAALAGMFGMAQFRGHLDELKENVQQIAALAILQHHPMDCTTCWTARRLQTTLQGLGCEQSINQCMILLDDLTLHHFLIWDDGVYRPGRWDFRWTVSQ
ncbi:MAG TPA: hypothetical protein VGE39_17475, partial [Prosthecobacter sp.]